MTFDLTELIWRKDVLNLFGVGRIGLVWHFGRLEHSKAFRPIRNVYWHNGRLELLMNYFLESRPCT
jgi:hypothetical protein